MATTTYPSSMTLADAKRILARQHDNKRTYGESIARLVAQRMSAAHGAKMEPYRCCTCREWHVGHSLDIRGMELLAEALRVVRNTVEDDE